MPIDRALLDLRTFAGPPILQGIAPKMVRKVKDDPKSEEVQATDEDGTLKWVVTVSAELPHRGSKQRFEDLAITIVSKTPPLPGVTRGQAVLPENLEMGTMKMEKGGFTQFFSASAIRPVTVQPQQPSR